VVTTINTLGETLLGSDFTPITTSPDDAVARILASDQIEHTRAGWWTFTVNRDSPFYDTATGQPMHIQDEDSLA